jgi:hypothetical protein
MRRSTNTREGDPPAGLRASLPSGDVSGDITASRIRTRQSLLDFGVTAAPPPTIMYKPGSSDENAGGFLRAMKRLTSSWKKRRVVATGTALQYLDPDTGKTAGDLPYSEISAVRMVNRAVMSDRGSPDNLRDFGWLLFAGGREYIFACESTGTRDVWVAYLTSMLRTRAEETAVAGAMGTAEGSGGGGTGDDDQMSRGASGGAASRPRASMAENPGATRVSAAGAASGGSGSAVATGLPREDEAEIRAEVQEANASVYTAIDQQKKSQFRLRDSDDGHGDDGPARVRDHDDHFDDEDDDDESSESQVVVERGDEVVALETGKGVATAAAVASAARAAAAAASSALRRAVPPANAAYRRENELIQALFDDLRSSVPDHARLENFEDAASACSYYVPTLLRAAQDLPTDRPRRPLLVADRVTGADPAEPPLQHVSVAGVVLPGLQRGINRLTLAMNMPGFKGAPCFVVDADGVVVGGSSLLTPAGEAAPAAGGATTGASAYELSKAVAARHSAARVFAVVTLLGRSARAASALSADALADFAWARGRAQSMAPPPIAATATAAATARATAAVAPGAGAPALPSALKRSSALAGFTTSVVPPTPAPALVTAPAPAPALAPAAAAADDDERGSVFGGIGRMLARSVTGPRLRDGAGSAMSATGVGNNATLVAAASIAVGGTREGVPCPAVHGPSLIIETTRRRIIVTDMAYRCDLLAARAVAAPPPLYLVTSIDAPAK